MRHEQHRASLLAQACELVEALLLERGVPDGEHLVDQQDVGVDLDGGGECEPNVHPRRVVLQLEIDELLELGERQDVVETLCRLLAGKPEHDRVDDHVVPSGEIRIESDAELDERRQTAVDREFALVDVVDPGEALEQRALAAAVAADDSEELAGRDLDAHVLDSPQDVEGPSPPRVERALLERVVVLVRKPERLADVLHRYCRPQRSGHGCAVRMTLLAQDRAHGADGSNGAVRKQVLLCAALEVCTIIAKNYVAHARVLAKSLAEHHPDGRLWTLVIDDFSRYLDPAEEPFEVLTPADIGCEPFTRMALRYTVLELSTAVKPWLLRHLLARTGGPVTYLDPDIKIYGSLARLEQLAADHGVVVIPHNNEPIPPDGLKPSQVDIMIAGVYNLGYVVAGAETRGRPACSTGGPTGCAATAASIRSGGTSSTSDGSISCPGFMPDLAIVRDPEYNVAYWNLHARKLERDGVGYKVDGRPLAFFHFSGFDADHPLVLSRYQNRVDVLADPVLEQLLAEYAAEVNGEGHAREPEMALQLRCARGRHAESTTRCARCTTSSPTNRAARCRRRSRSKGSTLFAEWLNAQAPDAPPGISRVLARVYRDRPDLQVAYPDLDGRRTRRAAALGRRVR